MGCEGDLDAIVKVTAWIMASMSYARFASSSFKPGNLRLVALLPVIILLPCLPCYFSSITLRGTSAFFLAWLGVFKLLLLAFGLGPLSPSFPLPTFIAISSLPVKIRPANNSPSLYSSGQLFLISCIKLLLIALIAPIYKYKPVLHPWLLLSAYCMLIYLFLELLFAAAALLAGSLLGLALEPQADAPLKSTSLHDFWGRRWNLMVTAILRPSVYRPVRLRFGVAAGVLAGFLVSGLMHEVIFYYMTLEAPTGEVTLFFVMQGLCTVAEAKGRKAGCWRLQEYPVVAVPLTIGFVTWTAFLLFFPPLLRGGADEKGVEELAAVLRVAEDGCRDIFRRVTMKMTMCIN